MSRAFRINEPTVIHDTIDGEVLVIHNDTGTYYSLDGSAADVWGCLAAGLDRDAVIDVLGARFEVGRGELGSVVDVFVDELVTHSLVIEVDDAPASGAAPPSLGEPVIPFAAPHLSAYTDMQDILMFDPIHEVSPQGWPNVVEGPA